MRELHGTGTLNLPCLSRKLSLDEVYRNVL